MRVYCFRTYKLNWALTNTTLQSKKSITASESRETKFLIQMETFTSGSGLLAPLSDKEGAQCFTNKEAYTKATGLKIRDQGQVELSFTVATTIQGIGRTTKRKVMVFTIMLAVPDMKGIIRTTKRRVMVFTIMLTVTDMKGILRTAYIKVMVFTIMLTVTDMKGIFRTTKRKVMVFTIMLPVTDMKGIGRKISEVGKVITLTRMGSKLKRIMTDLICK